jgi:hypothetical protein
MSCTNCNNSNCSCSDNCPNKVSDITVFDCNSFNVIEVPCDASLCDVLGLLESYTTNMVNELSTMTSVTIAEGNCIGLEAGTYGIQQVIDSILEVLCNQPCPLFVSISQGVGDELVTSTYGGVPPYSYQWSIQDNIGDVTILGSSTGSSVVIGGTSGLNKFGLVKVIASDDKGCSASDTFFWKLPVVD